MNNFIKNQKGKLMVLLLYIIVVFVSPFLFFSQQKAVVTMQSLVPQNIDQFFRQYIAILQEGNTEKAYSFLSPQVRQNTSLSSFSSFPGIFASTTDKMELVEVNVEHVSGSNIVGSATDYNVTYEIAANKNETKFILAHFGARDSEGTIQIYDVNAMLEHTSIKDQGKVDFNSQGVYILLSILLPLFIIYTAFRYIKKTKEPKWLHFLVILLLSVYLTMSKGGVSIFLGLNSFMSKAGTLWGPLMFSMPIPVGAILYYSFLLKNKFSKKNNKDKDSSYKDDLAVIDNLKKNGSDLNKEHECDFHFYGSDNNLLILQDKLKNLGFSLTPGYSKPGTISMSKKLKPQPEVIHTVTDELLDLCNPLDIDYDGWGAMIVK